MQFRLYDYLPILLMFVVAAGFAELDHYYRPDGLPREQQPWLATVWRKLATTASKNATP